MIPEQDPPTPASLTPVRRVQVVRVESGRRVPSDDNAAAEEPLDVRLHGRSFATIMRTPGDDRALAAGFLYAERVVRSSDEIGAVEHCRHPDRGEVHHVVDVFLRGEAAQSAQRHLDERRHVVANSSCGICGRTSIAELRGELTPIDTKWSVEPAIIRALPDTLRARQSRFEQTGGLHAAGLFDRQAACRCRAKTSGVTTRWTKWSARCCSTTASVDRIDAHGQRPRIIRDRAEGVDGGDPAGGRCVRLLRAWHRSRARAGITLLAFVRGRASTFTLIP